MNEGAWLRERVRAMTTVTALAGKAGVSREVLNKYFGMAEVDGRPDVVRAILQAIGVPDGRLQRRPNYASLSLAADDSSRPDPLVRQMMKNAIEYFRDVTDEENVEPYSEQTISEPIPLFDLCIAAGHWVDVIDNEDGGHRVTDAQIRQGIFRVRLRGDSMTPRFPDGAVVEFRLLRTPEGTPDFEATAAEECYYVQKRNGTATFKCLVSRDETTLTLRAINKRKYKEPLSCEVEEVVKLASFEWLLSKGK